jgi:hypothetical protein
MKERSDTVRVSTHPKTWRRQYPAGARGATSAPRDVGIRSHHLSDSPFFRVSCGDQDLFFRSLPRTYTHSSDSEYSISADVIQRVICECISRIAPPRPSLEIT